MWDPRNRSGQLGAAARGAWGRGRRRLSALPFALPPHRLVGTLVPGEVQILLIIQLRCPCRVSSALFVPRCTVICSCPHSHSPANPTCLHLFMEPSTGDAPPGSSGVCCCSLAWASSVPHLVLPPAQAPAPFLWDIPAVSTHCHRADTVATHPGLGLLLTCPFCASSLPCLKALVA